MRIRTTDKKKIFDVSVSATKRDAEVGKVTKLTDIDEPGLSKILKKYFG